MEFVGLLAPIAFVFVFVSRQLTLQEEQNQQ